MMDKYTIDELDLNVSPIIITCNPFEISGRKTKREPIRLTPAATETESTLNHMKRELSRSVNGGRLYITLSRRTHNEGFTGIWVWWRGTGFFSIEVPQDDAE